MWEVNGTAELTGSSWKSADLAGMFWVLDKGTIASNQSSGLCPLRSACSASIDSAFEVRVALLKRVDVVHYGFSGVSLGHRSGLGGGERRRGRSSAADPGCSM